MFNFLRPEYFFRPSQIVRRLGYYFGITRNSETAILPWDLTIRFEPKELHGRSILTLGLSDIRTNEIISRIVTPGDISVDIGANIGVMTSLMARRAGPNGTVFAFEPHPQTRQLLKSNSKMWSTSEVKPAEVSILSYAVSSSKGRSFLTEPKNFFENSGIASLEGKPESATLSDVSFEVETISFDEWAEGIEKIKLVKIDVEGHEDKVLDGMRGALENRLIAYIIFEEMRPIPTIATEIFKRYGYRCFLIDRDFWGPVLRDVSENPAVLIGEATNILAIADGQDVKELTKRGWSCLR